MVVTAGLVGRSGDIVSRSRFALALIGIGVVMILVGVVDAASSSGDVAPSVAAATSTTAAVSSTRVSEPTTTAPEAVSTTTTSTVVMTTITLAPLVTTTSLTSTTSSTTSTTAGNATSETVEEFVVAFAAAIAASDVDFLFERLHPAVVGGFGPALCRSWIEGEILLLGDYKLAGPVEGPRDQTFTTPAGTGTIADAFSAPVSFVFQGQSFDGEGGFALVDGIVMWLGQCR
jgi:hypothetical protein